MSTSSFDVLWPNDEESFEQFGQRIKAVQEETIILFAGREPEFLAEPEVLKSFLETLKKQSERLHIATKDAEVAEKVRKSGFRVLDRTAQVRSLLHGHPKEQKALRLFSPQLWRQQLQHKLQHVGILSVPKMRIWSLAGLSLALFYVVMFKLLPSAEVRIKPRQEPVSQTINVFLVSSGATADVSQNVRQMELIPLEIEHSITLTMDHISKEFIGNSSTLYLTIVNESSERYELRTGTRFQSADGIIFRIQEPALVGPGEEVTVRSIADDLDLYGDIIGERGNVASGTRFDVPGLAPEERVQVYGEARVNGAGGTTAYRTVLREEDIDIVRKRLEQELLADAKTLLERRQESYNRSHPEQYLNLLNAIQYEKDLIAVEYKDFTLPYHLVGQEVSQLPVSGSIYYRVFGYDAERALSELETELRDHVQEGRRLIDDNLTRQNMVAYVIDFSDTLSWIKLTVELNAAEEYLLQPLTPQGALFAKQVRELITGISREEALRIVRNLPEVERVTIRQWPPWQKMMPGIASHITIDLL